jgi:hypothetical protein
MTQQCWLLPRAPARTLGRLALFAARFAPQILVTSGGLEPPAYGLGNRRSILLSYEVMLILVIKPAG